MINFSLPKTTLSVILISLSLLFIFSCTPQENFEELVASDTAPIHADNPGFENTDEGCIHPDPNGNSIDDSELRTWDWRNIHIPPYSYGNGSSFGDGLHVDVAFDENGVKVEGDFLRFRVNAALPAPSSANSPYHYRSEIRTAPWRIQHPLGTEQWIGWTYTFGEQYVPDHTAPITIFQNHPGISGLSPVFELTLSQRHNHLQNPGGEVEFVNKGHGDRINYSNLRPLAGDKLDIVVHVVYGIEANGLLEVWLNGERYYSKNVSTVYDDHQYGGNNKWGVYHHRFNNSGDDVASSLAIGAGHVELSMSTLKMLTRTPADEEYLISAYEMVKP